MPSVRNGLTSIPRIHPYITMKPLLLLSPVLLLCSCAAGVVDRTEDRYDRREDRVDRRHYSGPGDRLEDRYDKREGVNDKLRGRRGLRY